MKKLEVMAALYRALRPETPRFTDKQYKQVGDKVQELINAENKMDDITITGFRANGRTIRPKEPYVVKGFMEQGLLMYSDDAIGLNCVVHKGEEYRAPLLIAEELSMLWREYAEEADDKLDTEALKLKQNLLERFGE